MADAFSRRKETRIPVKLFLNLFNPEHPSFEVVPTIDISCHGARVVTKTFWEPDQCISVRSIRGNLYSRARVVHCRRYTSDSFAVGLEMYYPERDWTTAVKPPRETRE